MAAIMDAARHCSQAHYLEIREKAIRYVVNQMDRYLLAQREYRTGCIVRIKHIVAKFCCVVGGNTCASVCLYFECQTLASPLGLQGHVVVSASGVFHILALYKLDYYYYYYYYYL